jgi:hypothetical protein
MIRLSSDVLARYSTSNAEIDFPATQLFPKQLAALKERMLGKLDMI